MADNEVLVSFKGKDDGLGKQSKEQKDNVKGVGDESKKTDDSLKKSGDSGIDAGDKIAKGFKVAAAAVAVVAAGIGKFAVDAVQAFSEYEQLAGGMQKIFDQVDYSKIAADASGAYATMNLSASQYMSTMAQVGAGFSSTMGDEKGYETAKKGMQAIADFASGTGKDVDYLMGKYQAITKATTSYQTIADQFSGILPATSADFLAQAQAAGYLADSYTDLTKVPIVEYQAAVTSMLEQGVQAQGLLGNTVAETASTISGSLNATKAAWSNTLAAFGSGDNNAIETALNSLMESASNFVGNIATILPDILTGVSTLITTLIPKIPPLMADLLPALIEGVVGVLDGLVDAIPDLLTTLKTIIPSLVDAVVEVFLSILDALPEIVDGLFQLFTALADALLDPAVLTQLIEALSQAILGLIDVMVNIMKNPTHLDTILQGALVMFMEIVKALPEIIIALVRALPTIIKGVVGFLIDPKNLKMVFDAFMVVGWELIKAIPIILVEILKAFADLIPGMGGIFNGVYDKIKEIWDGIITWFKGIPDKVVEAIGTVKDKIGGLFTGAVEGAKKGFVTAINWIIGKINGLISGANKIVKWIPGVDEIPKIKEISLAEGGYVSGPGTSTSDSIPAMLSDGEYVIKAAAVRQIGVENLHALNEGQIPRNDAPIVGEINHYAESDPLALAQQIGAMVRFA